jgi:hypothetical protein
VIEPLFVIEPFFVIEPRFRFKPRFRDWFKALYLVKGDTLTNYLQLYQ